MANKLHLTVGIKGKKVKTLYIGADREKARTAFSDNRDNEDFDFVGFSPVSNWLSRARPVDDRIAQEARDRRLAAKAEKEANEALDRAVALQAALAAAAEKAEEEALAAEQRRAALLGENATEEKPDEEPKATEEDDEEVDPIVALGE